MTRSLNAQLAVLVLVLLVGGAAFLGGRGLARRGAPDAPTSALDGALGRPDSPRDDALGRQDGAPDDPAIVADASASADAAAALIDPDAAFAPNAADASDAAFTAGASDAASAQGDRDAPVAGALVATEPARSPPRPPAGGADTGGVSVGIIVPGKASLGEPAPPFALVTPDNKTISLARYAGQPLVLNFFATWCAPCRAEMPYLQRAHEAYQAEGLAIVGIDLRESAELVLPFLGQLGLTFPVGLDSHGAVSEAYRVSTLPTTYFIDAAGEVATSRIGPFTSEDELEAALRQILPAAGGS